MKMISSAEREMKLEKDDGTTLRKRKSPDVPIDVLGLAGVRCEESCARSHKGIAYCIAHVGTIAKMSVK